MVYRIAGVLVAILGAAAVLAPRFMLQWEQRRQRTDSMEVTDERVLMMRVAGLAFVGIGLGFVAIDHYGLLA